MQQVVALPNLDQLEIALILDMRNSNGLQLFSILSRNWNKVRIKHKWVGYAVKLHRIILPLATCPTLVTALRRPERSIHKKNRVKNTAMKGDYLHLGQGKWQPGQESSRQSHKSRPECSKTPCSTLSLRSMTHAGYIITLGFHLVIINAVLFGWGGGGCTVSPSHFSFCFPVTGGVEVW